MGTSRGLPAGHVDETPWLVRLRAGAAYVAAHPVVRPLVLGEALLLVLFTMASPIEIVYAKESLGGGDATYGTLLTAWGAGVIIGSLLFARVHSRPLPVLIAGSTVIIGFAYVGMAAAPSLGPAAAAAVLGGIGNGMQWVVVVTAIQEAVRDDMQARVAGFFEAIATAAPGVGFMLGGVLAQVFTPRVAFATAGFGVLLVVLLGGSLVGPAPWDAATSWRVRADHPLAAIDVPIAEVGTVAMSEVAAAPTLPHVPG